jgi:hypothetical protein
MRGIFVRIIEQSEFPFLSLKKKMKINIEPGENEKFLMLKLYGNYSIPPAN